MNTLDTETRSRRSDELEHLLRGCQRGEARAWDRLLTLVRALALDLGRMKYRLSREDAEDVAQVVQIRVAQRIPQLRENAAFPSWVRRIAHHAALDAIRQRRPMLSLDEPLPTDETGAALQTAERYDQVALRADLDRALARLPSHYRDPIKLHLLYEVPQDEVGRLLGRPRSTVASQIERGLRRLRRSLPPAPGW